MPFDWFTVVAQVLNFLVLVWILKRVFYRPVLKAMAERQKRVQKTIRDAAAEKDQAALERKKLEQDQAELAGRRDAMIQAAQAEAATERTRLLDEARRDFELARVRWREALATEQGEFQHALVQKAKTELLSIARQVLTDLADSDLQDRVVMKFLKKVENLKEADRQKLQDSMNDSRSGKTTIRSAFALTAPSLRLVENAARRILGKEITMDAETKPSLICGLELCVDGRKIAWSFDEYLRSLNLCVQEMIVHRVDSHEH